MNYAGVHSISQLDLMNTMPEILIVALILIIVRILYIATLFQKAGEKWWYSIIPIYNNWIMIKIGINKAHPLFLLLYLVPYVNVLYAMMIEFVFIKAYKVSTPMAILYLIIPPIIGPIVAITDKYQYSEENKVNL